MLTHLKTVPFLYLFWQATKAKLEDNILAFGTYLSSVVEMKITACWSTKRRSNGSQGNIRLIKLEKELLEQHSVLLQAFFFSLFSKRWLLLRLYIINIIYFNKKPSFARCHPQAGTSIKNLNVFLSYQIEKRVRKAEKQ